MVWRRICGPRVMDLVCCGMPVLGEGLMGCILGYGVGYGVGIEERVGGECDVVGTSDLGWVPQTAA